VSQFSPYITHGVITIDEIVKISLERYTIDEAEMRYKELLRREYFTQVHFWKGDAIFADMEEDKTKIEKQDSLPAEVQSKTFASGWVNQCILQLETTGYLHNHQRMRLASYMSHRQKLYRKKCADWTYYHFLDGEL
jgi:deoxyribodipyrimidine photo-lyase